MGIAVQEIYSVGGGGGSPRGVGGHAWGDGGDPAGGDVEIAHSMWPEERSVTGRPRRPHRCGEHGGKEGAQTPRPGGSHMAIPWGLGQLWGAAKTSQQWGDRCNKLVKRMREEDTGEGRRRAQPQGRPRSPIRLGHGAQGGDGGGPCVTRGGGRGMAERPSSQRPQLGGRS